MQHPPRTLLFADWETGFTYCSWARRKQIRLRQKRLKMQTGFCGESLRSRLSLQIVHFSVRVHNFLVGSKWNRHKRGWKTHWTPTGWAPLKCGNSGLPLVNYSDEYESPIDWSWALGIFTFRHFSASDSLRGFDRTTADWAGARWCTAGDSTPVLWRRPVGCAFFGLVWRFSFVTFA